MTERDKADLQRAEDMVAEGKRLRRQVLARIRQRNWRGRQSTHHRGA